MRVEGGPSQSLVSNGIFSLGAGPVTKKPLTITYVSHACLALDGSLGASSATVDPERTRVRVYDVEVSGRRHAAGRDRTGPQVPLPHACA